MNSVMGVAARQAGSSTRPSISILEVARTALASGRGSFSGSTGAGPLSCARAGAASVTMVAMAGRMVARMEDEVGQMPERPEVALAAPAQTQTPLLDGGSRPLVGDGGCRAGCGW